MAIFFIPLVTLQPVGPAARPHPGSVGPVQLRAHHRRLVRHVDRDHAVGSPRDAAPCADRRAHLAAPTPHRAQALAALQAGGLTARAEPAPCSTGSSTSRRSCSRPTTCSTPRPCSSWCSHCGGLARPARKRRAPRQRTRQPARIREPLRLPSVPRASHWRNRCASYQSANKVCNAAASR